MSNNNDKAIARFLKEADSYLAAYAKVSEHPMFTIFPKETTQFVLLTEMSRRFKPAIYKASLPDLRSTAYVNLIAREFMTVYDMRKGYAYQTHLQLSKSLDLALSSIENHIPQLLKTGLWGRVKGQGLVSTRYYPLFTEKGMSEYLKLVEGAKAGIHPNAPKKVRESAIDSQDETVQIDGINGVVDANGEIHDIEQEPASDASEQVHDDIEPPLDYEAHEYETTIPEEPYDPEATPPDPHETSDSASYGPLL